MQLVGIVRRLHHCLVRARCHTYRPARAVVAGGKAKTSGLREREHLNIVNFPRPEGRSVSGHNSGGGSPIAASLQRRTSPAAGPNRAQATYPTGGRWRRGTIPGTPRIRILVGAGPDPLAYVRTGPVSSQKPGIAGASHHRTKEVHHRTEEVLRPVGLYLPGVWSLDGRA